MRKYETVAILGDTHFPFHHKETVAAFIAHVRKNKPRRVVQIGDLYDLYNWSRWPRSQSLMTPEDELRKARSAGEKFWKDIRSAVPRAECLQVLGNHDDRIYKLVKNKVPEIADLLNFVDTHKKLWEFPGVQTAEDGRDEFIRDDVVYYHGSRTKLGDHVAFFKQNIVVGHSHQGGVIWQATAKEPQFELNAGHSVDTKAPAFTYPDQKRTNWVRGFGVIETDGPRFIAV